MCLCTYIHTYIHITYIHTYIRAYIHAYATDVSSSSRLAELANHGSSPLCQEAAAESEALEGEAAAGTEAWVMMFRV